MTERRKAIRKLLDDRRRLIWLQNGVIRDIVRYKAYFKNRKPNEAENAFYGEQFRKSSWGEYEEFQFSRGHLSLKERLRDLRKILAIYVRNIRRNKEEYKKLQQTPGK